MEGRFAFPKTFICLTNTDTALVNLINFEALTRFGPIHVATLQRTEADIWKDAEYIASKIKDCVQALGGTERVVGFVSDNENLMTSVWSMLEVQLDRFLCAPCLAHVGNLLLKDIGKIYWIEQILNRTKEVVLFFRNHSYPLLLFRSKKSAYPLLQRKHLKFPCMTRFGSNYKMLEHAFLLRTPLQETVIDERFKKCSAYKAAIKNCVLSDDFWGHVNDAKEIMAPVYLFLREVDSNGFHIGHAYEKIRGIGQSIASCQSTEKAEALQLFQQRLYGTSRKVGFHSPVHSAALLLAPHNWEIDFATKLGNEEYSKIRADFTSVIEKISRSNNDAVQALMQYDREYKGKQLHYFQTNIVQKSAKHGDAMWWKHNGSPIPQLQDVACRVLTMGVANSAAERNWKIHAFMHSKARYSLSFEKTCKLVNVYCNSKAKQKLQNAAASSYYSDAEFGDEDDQALNEAEDHAFVVEEEAEMKKNAEA